MKYRKKSLPALEITAFHLTMENAEEIADWCGGALIDEIDPFDSSKKTPGINVPTYSGKERASLGDVIAQTASDEFIVRKPNAFKDIWEPVP